MRVLLKRLIILLLLGIGITLVWDQRDKIALLANNNLRIQGDWYRMDGELKGSDRYRFSERIITLNGDEWGSYELRKNTELEIMSRGELRVYHLEFPDDDNMVWSIRSKGELVPRFFWQR